MMLKFIFITLSVILILTGCNKTAKNKSDKIIAEVAGKVMYQSDLNEIYTSKNMANSDSSDFAKAYIEQWIKQQLLVAEAENILSTKELDIKKELELYRQELIIYKYKNLRINSLTDTVVTEQEIESYYKKNIKSFLLKHEIVKVNYIIFPIEVEIPKTFKQELVSSNDITEAEDFIFKFAKKYDNFNDNWVYFDNLTQPMQKRINNVNDFLNTHKLIDFTTETELHLIVINDYRLINDKAPLDFVSPRIRSLLLNAKKLDFLREIKDSLYNNALKYNKFRVFN